MNYIVKKIPSFTEIETCPPLPIDHVLWNTTYVPESYAQIGLLESYGFLIKLSCKEENPLTTYTNFNDPVFLDSALEFFFQPFPNRPEYINFEVNSNGALLSQIGTGKTHRKNISPKLLSLCNVEAEKKETHWSVLLCIPYSFLQEMYSLSLESFKGINTFRFNCYKISEAKSNTHFLSAASIDSAVPNFHLPEFFACALVES
ncbi:MAG: carbohydrate-binding family 9-like protein [Acetivibrio sp.]